MNQCSHTLITIKHSVHILYLQYFQGQILLRLVYIYHMKCKFVYIFVFSVCTASKSIVNLIFIHFVFVISIFISTGTHILFLVNPQCLHVTQKLTEAGSIVGDICHQQCMTVEKSV